MGSQEIRRGAAVPMVEESPAVVTAHGIGRVHPVRRHRLLRVRSARQALEPFGVGMDFECMTNGEFSVLDALLVLLERMGRPVDLVVSTWSVGLYDVEVINRLLGEGRLRSFRLVLDVSFKNSRGASGYAGQLLPIFESGNVRTIRSHAKYFLLHDGAEGYSLSSTANLNENKRLELMYFSDSPDRLAWYLRLTEEVFAEVPEGWNPDTGAPDLSSIDPVEQEMQVGAAVKVGAMSVDAMKPDGSRRAPVQTGQVRLGNGGN